ncbi:RHS repeat protein, partial [Xanthomonas axonopodis pv. begoniae]|nr:RHS repeat protein [Xanthomonas axonopodis pv. begoniae]
MDDSSVVRQEAVDKAAPFLLPNKNIRRPMLGLGAFALLMAAQDVFGFGHYVCGGGYTSIGAGRRVFTPVCWFQEDFSRSGGHVRGPDGGGGGGSGGGFSTSPGAKEQPTNDKRDSADCSGEKSGNPVVISTGNKVEPELDFAANGEMGLYLERTYNAFWTARGLFGTYWLSNFDYTLVPAGNTIWAQRPDGRRIKFLLDAGSGHYLEEKASPVAFVVKQADGSFVLYNETRGTEKYDKRGYITERRNEQGIAWSFRYDGAYLQEVTHTSGRSIKFAWADGVVTQAIDPAGNVYRYGYQQNVFGLGLSKGRLASATLPGAPETVISYHYEDARFVGALTGKSFNGQRYSTFAYDAQGRATSTEHAGGVERFSFSYSVPATQAITPPPAPLPPGGFTGGETGGSCSTPRPGSGEICVRPSSVGGGAVRLSAQSMSTKDGLINA